MGLLARFFGSPRDRFADEALRITRRTPGIARASYDPDKFAVAAWRDRSAGPVWIYLANVFAETADASPAERRDRLAQLVRIILTPHDEDTWEQVRPKGTSTALMTAHWPDLAPELIDAKADADLGWVIRLIGEVRALRTEMNVAPGAQVNLVIKDAGAETKIRQARGKSEEKA